jgi:hypothetical protein
MMKTTPLVSSSLYQLLFGTFVLLSSVLGSWQLLLHYFAFRMLLSLSQQNELLPQALLISYACISKCSLDVAFLFLSSSIFAHWTSPRVASVCQALSASLLFWLRFPPEFSLSSTLSVVLQCSYILAILLQELLLLASHLNHQDVALRIFGFLTGTKARRIRDPDLIHAILKDYTIKGDALERRCSLPAWSPVRSLESVDHAEWEDLHNKLVLFMQRTPPPSELRGIVRACLSEYTGDLDSIALSRVSIMVFIEYLFGRKWESKFEILVSASMEWRREIALRGRGDMKTKMDAVACVVELLRASQYWDLFGESWADPSCYSIVIQPFIISPAINIADIMVSVGKMRPGDAIDVRSLINQAHPFPILERLVDDDRYLSHGILSGTHVFMFTSDMQPRSAFGAGKRICAGVAHATAVLETLIEERSRFLFHPTVNHLYSGRDNDTNMSMKEAAYFAAAVARAIFARSSAALVPIL